VDATQAQGLVYKRRRGLRKDVHEPLAAVKAAVMADGSATMSVMAETWTIH